MNAIIIVPTIREDCIKDFLEAWSQELAGHRIFVIEDHAEKQFTISGPSVTHYSWHDIEADLGDIAWIIPRTTAAVKSYLILKAYLLHPDMIVCLDDDCYPSDKGFLEAHYKNLTEPVSISAWVSSVSGTQPRGMPYANLCRKGQCVLSHGLWVGNMDYDAPTELMANRIPMESQPIEQIIPLQQFFPMCIMNIAFKPELAPLMYQLHQGEKYRYSRFDDIWSGLFVKKICDHLRYYIRSGFPLIHHTRKSNVWRNMEGEARGLEANETLWEVVDGIQLTAKDVIGAYAELVDALPAVDAYWVKMKEAMNLWLDLFRGR